jgi:hypothetical protein
LLTKFIKLTLLLLGICVLSAAPVFADQTFTFGFTSPLGNLGPSHTYTSGGLSLTASGWARAFFPNNLFAKSHGADEVGLGLLGGIDNEISNLPVHAPVGTAFVQLNIASMLAGLGGRHLLGLSISMDSITERDGYSVLGGVPGSGLGDISFVHGSMSPNFTVPISNFLPSGTCGLAGATPCTFINITAGGNGQSVLLDNVQVVTTPEPSSAGLLLIGLGALVAAGTLGKKLLA